MKIYERKSAGKKGWGLYATKDIPKGKDLGEYSGRILVDIGESQLAAMLGYTTMYAFSEHGVIDPEDWEFGTELCMGNSSHAPNSEFIAMGDFLMPHLVTTKLIKKGQEITYEYNLEVPPTPYLRKKWKCLCGVKNCPGDMLAWNDEGPSSWRRDEKVFSAKAEWLIEFLIKHGPRNDLQKKLANLAAKDDLKWLSPKLREATRKFNFEVRVFGR